MLHARAAGTSRQAVILASVLTLHFGLFLVVTAIKVDVPQPNEDGSREVMKILPWKPKPEARPEAPERWEIGPERVPKPDDIVWQPEETRAANDGESLTGETGEGALIPVSPDVVKGPTLALDQRRLSALVNACYPASARRSAEEGKALVRVVIGAGGRVISWHLLQGTGFPRLDEAVSCVMSRLSFNPGTRNGVAVQSEVDLPVVFRLN